MVVRGSHSVQAVYPGSLENREHAREVRRYGRAIIPEHRVERSHRHGQLRVPFERPSTLKALAYVNVATLVRHGRPGRGRNLLASRDAAAG